MEDGELSWKKEAARRFFKIAGALSGGSSSMGVSAVKEGRKMLKLLRRLLLSDISREAEEEAMLGFWRC